MKVQALRMCLLVAILLSLLPLWATSVSRSSLTDTENRESTTDAESSESLADAESSESLKAEESIESQKLFDWEPVMEAIILVESGGNPNAVCGSSVGAMQITPILVRECNNILKSRGSNIQYTLADRYDVGKSKEMFLLIQSRYNPANDIERAIRTWNGGPRYSVRATEGYYRKVMRRME